MPLKPLSLLLIMVCGCTFNHQTFIKVYGKDIKYSWPNSVSGSEVNMEIESNAVYGK